MKDLNQIEFTPEQEAIYSAVAAAEEAMNASHTKSHRTLFAIGAEVLEARLDGELLDCAYQLLLEVMARSEAV